MKALTVEEQVQIDALWGVILSNSDHYHATVRSSISHTKAVAAFQALLSSWTALIRYTHLRSLDQAAVALYLTNGRSNHAPHTNGQNPTEG